MNVIRFVHYITGYNHLILCGNSLGIVALDITPGGLLNATLRIGDINLGIILGLIATFLVPV